MPSDRPDVALVSVYPRPGVRHSGSSGVASYTANLAHALTAAGARTRVVAPRQRDQPHRARDGDVEVTRIFPRGLGAGPVAIAAAVASGAPVVHVQFELFLYGRSATPGLLATLAGLGRRRARLVVTAHQVVDPTAVDAGFVRMHGLHLSPALARRGIETVQRAVGTLPAAAVVHEDAFADHLPHAVVIPHGVERRQRMARDPARRRCGLDDDRLVALCFGFVAPYKGLELACEATRLADGVVQLVIAGGEHPRHGSGYLAGLRGRYEGTARFPGFVPEDELAAWFAAADVALLLYPQPHAASGSLALALAYGTPVLLSPMLARLVGAPASLTAPEEPGALAERLRRLAAAPDEREALGRATARLLEGRSWPEVAARHLELYEEVIDADAAPGRRASLD